MPFVPPTPRLFPLIIFDFECGDEPMYDPTEDVTSNFNALELALIGDVNAGNQFDPAYGDPVQIPELLGNYMLDEAEVHTPLLGMTPPTTPPRQLITDLPKADRVHGHHGHGSATINKPGNPHAEGNALGMVPGLPTIADHGIESLGFMPIRDTMLPYLFGDGQLVFPAPNQTTASVEFDPDDFGSDENPEDNMPEDILFAHPTIRMDDEEIFRPMEIDEQNEYESGYDTGCEEFDVEMML